MSTDAQDGTQEQVRSKSGRRYSTVGPGRVAAGKRLHELGLAGMGGRKPTHGRRALAELVRRGEQLDGPIGELTRELETAYSVDYGGREDLSTAEKALIKRLVVLDVDLYLAIAERDRAVRFSKAQAIAHAQAISRNCAAFSQLVKVLGGPGRRQKPADRTIILRDPRKVAEAPPTNTGQAQGSE